MQQFVALLKKEIGGYFKSCFAYLIFFIYLGESDILQIANIDFSFSKKFF